MTERTIEAVRQISVENSIAGVNFERPYKTRESLLRKLSTLESDLRVQEGHIIRLSVDADAKEPVMLKALNADLRFNEALSMVPEDIREEYLRASWK